MSSKLDILSIKAVVSNYLLVLLLVAPCLSLNAGLQRVDHLSKSADSRATFDLKLG